MTVEMFREPKKMVEDISALGLRHVGYAIPTEFFAPFVSGAVEVLRTMTTDLRFPKIMFFAARSRKYGLALKLGNPTRKTFAKNRQTQLGVITGKQVDEN
jgi:hypothetical protein